MKVRYLISPFLNNYYVDQDNLVYCIEGEKKNISVSEIYAGIDLFAGLSCIHRSINK